MEIEQTTLYRIFSINDQKFIEDLIAKETVTEEDRDINLLLAKLALIIKSKKNGKINDKAISILTNRDLMTSILNGKPNINQLKKILNIEIEKRNGIKHSTMQLINSEYIDNSEVMRLKEELINLKVDNKVLSTKNSKLIKMIFFSKSKALQEKLNVETDTTRLSNDYKNVLYWHFIVMEELDSMNNPSLQYIDNFLTIAEKFLENIKLLRKRADKVEYLSSLSNLVFNFYNHKIDIKTNATSIYNRVMILDNNIRKCQDENGVELYR